MTSTSLMLSSEPLRGTKMWQNHPRDFSNKWASWRLHCASRILSALSWLAVFNYFNIQRSLITIPVSQVKKVSAGNLDEESTTEAAMWVCVWSFCLPHLTSLFFLTVQHVWWDLSSPTRDSNPGPQQSKHQVLTTGPPGDSLPSSFDADFPMPTTEKA